MSQQSQVPLPPPIPAPTSKRDKFYAGLNAIIPTLPREHQEVLRQALTHVHNDTDIKYVMEWLKNPKKWRMPRVSMDTFLDDPFYLGTSLRGEDGSHRVFPKVREICRQVIEGEYLEGVEVAGIGSGKSFSSSILACYMAHKLLCMRDPFATFTVARDKPIAIMNMGTTATQALDVVFTSINTFIAGSNFFQQFGPKMLTGSIEFESEKILLRSGNSKSTTPLGYNVFCAVLDEAAFYLDNENKSVAQDIYESLQKRIVSRFGLDGLIMMISSPRYVGDFIMKKLEESRKTDPETGELLFPQVFAVQAPIWKFKGVDYYKNDKYPPFFFNCRTNQIINEKDMPRDVILRTFKTNLLDNPQFDMSYQVWEVPFQYKAAFQKNPDKAKRDLGSVPSLTLEGFFPNPMLVSAAFNRDRENPLGSKPGEFKFKERPYRIPYFIHIDIGMNKNGEGDHTGFAMGHFGGWIKDEESGEMRMKYVIDVMERIGYSQETGEVDLGKVRQRIYDLKKMGYYIKMITLDRYQSRDFMQTLRKKGFRSELVSVDEDVEPYNLLKEAIHENRIDIPYYEIVEQELIQLELVKGIKVDHPEGGSKDVSDAVAGVVFDIHEHTPANTMGVATVVDPASHNVALDQHQKLKAKEDEIRMKQEIVRMQDDMAEQMGW